MKPKTERAKIESILVSLGRALKALREAQAGNSEKRMFRMADIEIVKSQATLAEILDELET